MNIKGIPINKPNPGRQIINDTPTIIAVIPDAFPNNANTLKIALNGICNIHNPKGKSKPNNVITAKNIIPPMIKYLCSSDTILIDFFSIKSRHNK